MEYSLQIDLAICLNTEYVWTRRTKIAIRYLFLTVILLFWVVGTRTPYTKTDAPLYGSF